MSVEKTYRIYRYTFPDGKQYIGKTSNTVNCRLHSHYRITSDIGAAIKQYGYKNIKTEVLHDNLTAEEADRLEKEEIINHGTSNNPNLLNAKEGGDRDCAFSEKVLQKLKQPYIDNPDLRKQVSEIVKENYKKYPNMRKAHIKSIKQLSLTGEQLASYESIKEASKQTGIGTSSISNCLSGLSISAGGSMWHYDNDKIYPLMPCITLNGKLKHSWSSTPIAQVNIQTEEIVAYYYSIADASNVIGIDRHILSNYLNNDNGYVILNGYKWIKL